MDTSKDASSIDLTSTTRRTTRSTAAPKSGSVWETRIKHDQVKGGFKVFNHDNNSDPTTTTQPLANKKLTPKQSPVSAAKRKTWKSDVSDLSTRLQIASELDDQKNNQLELRKTRSVVKSGDASPVLLRKLKSESDQAVVLAVVNGGGDEKLVKDESLMKKSRSDEEFGVCEEKSMNTDNVDRIEARGVVDDDGDGEIGVELAEGEIEKKKSVKEMSLQEQKPSRVVVEKKKWNQSNERPVPFSSVKKQQVVPVVVKQARVDPAPPKTKPSTEHFHEKSPRIHSRLQSFVDLVMWRDISRSAFVFGIGTFLIISSSFTKDLNISFISVISYLGLIYLAAIFLFRTFVKRGSGDMGKSDQDYVVGEEEAIWLVKMILPYVNEFLLNLRALFSGDPTTTMKLAVLLFVLARCGGSITIWKMSKLGFFGVFTIPKICSAYSSQLTAYGKFWIRRFQDAWESCSHKKAVGFAIFTLVWNLAPVVTRIWAVFMLFVAFKYYQQSLIREGCLQQETTTNGSSWRSGQNIGGRRRTTSSTEIEKQKKPC